MSAVQDNHGERVATAAQAQQQAVLGMLHRKYRRVPLPDLEDAFARTVSDLFTNPGRLAEVDVDLADGSEFMQLLVNAASMDVLDLLRSQGRRGEATVSDFERGRKLGDVNAAELAWKDGDASAAGTAAQQYLDNRSDATSDTDSALAEGKEAHRLLEYLAALPERDRTIAAMVLEGMKPRHIAAQVSLSAKEVSRSWERSQGRLRTLLAQGLDETRLCGLVAPDLELMRQDGTVTKNLKQHIRNCEGCAYLVTEQVGSRAAAIIGIPLPLVASIGGGGWFLLGRHGRKVVVQARHLLGSAGGSATGQATTVAAKVAVAAAVTIPTATAVTVVAAHALSHHHPKPPAHHLVITTPTTTPVAPVVTTPVVTTPAATAPTKVKRVVKHHHKPKPKVKHHHKRKAHVATTTTSTYTPPPVTTQAVAPPPATSTQAVTHVTAPVTHTAPPKTTSSGTSGGSLSGGGLPTPSQSNAAP